MKTIPILFAVFLLVCCSPQTPSGEETASQNTAPSLREVWVSDTTLRTPESVLYDTQRDVLYVANVNQNPWDKDGNGFISRLDPEGNILDLEWVSGLHGPKGMGIRENSLFVADIDAVVEIDLESGETTARYELTGTPTLNDITVFEEEVYVSGSDSNTVFELRDGGLSAILEGELGRPNGLFAEADRLLMITSKSSQLLAIDKSSRQTRALVDSLGHGDGIVPVGNGDYLASSWKGELFYITSEWQRIPLLDTREDEINAADIEYVIDKNLLLVPTFFDNRVVAYELIR